MKISNKIKFYLIALLIILNIILRFQVISHEIGVDSFLVHVMVNSLNEFGYAKWFLNPLSIVGIYPASYTSSVQFIISGLSQSTSIGMRSIIFLYCSLIGVFSVFTSYLMARELSGNDIFKILTAFFFSISPAVLQYTTWTIPARGLLIVMAPLLFYMISKSHTSFKYILLTILFSMFLFATHHLFYYLIPLFFIFIFITLYIKYNQIHLKIPANYIPILIVAGFLLMYSIPFFTGKFIESSRYFPVYISYFRYMGILLIPAIGGLGYLIYKQKNFGEWAMLIYIITLTTFVYQQTYMKHFLLIVVAPLASLGFTNILGLSNIKRIMPCLCVFFLILFVFFSGYYQFLSDIKSSNLKSEESTYQTGMWMRYNVDGVSIANNQLLGTRTFAISETSHQLMASTITNQIYGFMSIDISNYKRYSLTDESFWFSGYEGRDYGSIIWQKLHMLEIPFNNSNISYFVEDAYAGGNIIWSHGPRQSKLLNFAYQESPLVYDNGIGRIWVLK